ncbi:MAG: hypothetical protein NBV65_04815 [Burkholderiaceae bacterium]|nr:hypothetical protein [Burkholderiaceae bacterium]
MKQMLLSVVLVGAAAGAHADWTKVDHPSSEFSLYVDRDTLKSSGVGLMQMWHMLDYPQAQKIDGKPFLSVKGQDEYDCDKRVRRDVLYLWHEGGMGGSHSVKSAYKPGPWIKPEPGSHDESLLAIACPAK